MRYREKKEQRMAQVKSEFGSYDDYTGKLAANTETYKIPDWCVYPVDAEKEAKRVMEIRDQREGKQTIKADAGKPRLSLVPTQILNDIAFVRAFGCIKYPSVDSWKQVEPERYRDAAFRHLIAYINDPKSVDEESGLPHLWHLACNIAFLCELEKE